MTRQGKSVWEAVNWDSCGMGSVLDVDYISNLVFPWVGKINQFSRVVGAMAALVMSEIR